MLRNALACKKKLTPTATVVLCLLCIVIGWYVNNLGIIGWLAILASVSYTILMCTTKNAQQMRYAVILSSSLWLVHDFYVQSYPTVISGSFLIAWTIIQILKHRRLHSYHKI